MELGEALRVARLVRGLSVREVAQGTGYPVWRVRALEVGDLAAESEEFRKVWHFLVEADRATVRT